MKMKEILYLQNVPQSPIERGRQNPFLCVHECCDDPGVSGGTAGAHVQNGLRQISVLNEGFAWERG